MHVNKIRTHIVQIFIIGKCYSSKKTKYPSIIKIVTRIAANCMLTNVFFSFTNRRYRQICFLISKWIFCILKNWVMKDSMEQRLLSVPFLIPIPADQYWMQLRTIIREELSQNQQQATVSTEYETPGLTYKPVLKFAEICKLFSVTKPTVYEWIKLGKLKPLKIRSRVFFLWKDVESLLAQTTT